MYSYLIFPIIEGIDIDIAARSLGGVIEDSELRAHEEALPVETHPIVLRTNLCPLLTIEAVVEIGGVATSHETTIAGRTEITVDTQPNLFRGER